MFHKGFRRLLFRSHSHSVSATLVSPWASGLGCRDAEQLSGPPPRKSLWGLKNAEKSVPTAAYFVFNGPFVIVTSGFLRRHQRKQRSCLAVRCALRDAAVILRDQEVISGSNLMPLLRVGMALSQCGMVEFLLLINFHCLPRSFLSFGNNLSLELPFFTGPYDPWETEIIKCWKTLPAA